MPSLPTKKLSQQPLLTTLPAGTTFPALLTPQAQANPALRNPRASQLATATYLDAALGDWNSRKNPLKVVRTTTDMLALNPLACCYRTRCLVLAPGPGEATDYELRYVDHAFAWNYICLDGTFDQDPAKRGDAKWYPASSPALPAYSQLLPAYAAGPPATGYAFTTDKETVRAYAGGSVELLFTPLADGPLPAPSNPAGDANWRKVGEVSTAPVPQRPPVTHVYKTLADRDAADPFTLCLGTTCVIPSLAETDPNKYSVVQYTPHSSSTFYVYQDDTFSGPLADASWQPDPRAPGIPLAGTTAGDPVTGPIQFLDEANNQLVQMDTLDRLSFRFLDATSGNELGLAEFGAVTNRLSNQLSIHNTANNVGAFLACSATGELLVNGPIQVAGDIEIADPTKGIIMTVGGTRVRAQIGGTAGAREWTFTDL